MSQIRSNNLTMPNSSTSEDRDRLVKVRDALKERLFGLGVCSILTFIVSWKIFLTPGYLSAGDLIPPFDDRWYFAQVGSAWNYAYSFGNVGATSSALFSLPLYFFHFVLGVDLLLSDKLWIFFYYWLSGIIVYEMSLAIFPKAGGSRWATLARTIATATFMLSPLTITEAVVPNILISGPAMFFATLELKRFLQFKSGAWSLPRISVAILLSAFYYPSVFLAISVSFIITLLLFMRTANRVGVLIRAGSSALASILMNLFWLAPLAQSLFTQGSVYGISPLPTFNLDELYANWGTRTGWNAIGVVSLTRTVLTPSLGYPNISATLAAASLTIVMVAFLAPLTARSSHRNLAWSLIIVVTVIFFIAIRDHPIIDALANLLALLWTSGIPLRTELWNLLKQPNIFIAYLPIAYGLLAGITVFGLTSKFGHAREGRSPSTATHDAIPSTTLSSKRIHRLSIGQRSIRTSIIAIAICVLVVSPLAVTTYQYSEQLTRAFNPSPLPTEFHALNDYFQQHPTTGRLLFLPPRSWGGVLYGWWPKQGLPIATWPLYAETPPTALLDSSTPSAWNLLLYLYVQGIIQGQISALGPFLSSLGSSYVAYSSEFVTPGLNVPPNQIVHQLQNQAGLSSSLDVGSLHLYHVATSAPTMYASNSNGMLIGGLSTMFHLYSFGYNGTEVPLEVAYELGPDSFTRLLDLSKYVFFPNLDSLADATLLLKAKNFVFPASTQASGWSTINDNSLFWIFNGAESDFNGDILYGGGASFSSKANSVLDLATVPPGNYDVWIRSMNSPLGGYLRVLVDGTPVDSLIQTNQTKTAMTWSRLPALHLSSGNNQIQIVNGAGLNAVNVLAVLPLNSYEYSRQKLLETLSGKLVYIVGNDTLSRYDPNTNTTSPAEGIAVTEEIPPIDFEMTGPGQYVANIDSNGPTFVVLTEYYDSQFAASQPIFHFPAQYVMNGYFINASGRVRLNLRYGATSLVENSRLVSLTSAAALITIVAVPVTGITTKISRVKTRHNIKPNQT